MKFSNSHEWVDIKDNVATVGVSEYGRMHLGQVVNIELPTVGKKVLAGEAIAVLESNKAAVDIHSPIKGEVCEINENVKKDINLINAASETKGWLFKLKDFDKKDYEKLFSLEEYKKQVSK